MTSTIRTLVVKLGIAKELLELKKKKERYKKLPKIKEAFDLKSISNLKGKTRRIIVKY